MLEIVVNILIDYLRKEVDLLKDVDREFNSIKDSLEIIKPCLKVADEEAERRESNPAVEVLLKKLRKVSYRMEDVTDEYILHLLEDGRDSGFIGCLKQVARCIVNCKLRHDIASEIQDIKIDVRDIMELTKIYNWTTVMVEISRSNNAKNVSTSSSDRGMASLEVDEVVGIEFPRKELNSLMAEKESLERMVISVVGEGGLGKTILVDRVYLDQKASEKFVRAWITVSKSYDKTVLLRTLMNKLCQSNIDESPSSDIGTMEEESLIRKLQDYLKEKRYVVVFDDVWDEDFWDSISYVLPNNNKASRVIITTRKNAVAPNGKELEKIYPLKHLPDDKARELFNKMAFPNSSCPGDLKEVSDKIIRKCGGVPLAIVAIARLLSKTKEKMRPQWEKFCQRLGSELNTNPKLNYVKKIILFSYHDLPYRLKACFLYFGIFPDDYSIRSERLVRLWIAEGFVKEESGKTLEEIAEEYLNELIHRNLVLVQNSLCRVHDIMHEIILEKNVELLVAKDGYSNVFDDDGLFRRLSIHTRTNGNLMNIKSTIHSVVTFGREELPGSFIDALMSAKFKLLKVLDFEDAALNFLPEQVGNLLHLRYLSLRKTKVKVVPKSIGRLRYLLTLDVKESLVDVLPIEIKMLRKLRHLLASSETNKHGVKIQNGFGNCIDLQELELVELANEQDGDGSLVEELRKLGQLRKLGIFKLKEEEGEDLCNAIENMSHLESLHVIAAAATTDHQDDNILDLQHISSPPESLQRLDLTGRLEEFPNWISKLENLVRITLRESRLTKDPLKFLQKLPSLLELVLHKAYDGQFLHVGKGGFPKLERLDLESMDELISVKVDAGALPHLRHVGILGCGKLEEFPHQWLYFSDPKQCHTGKESKVVSKGRRRKMSARRTEQLEPPQRGRVLSHVMEVWPVGMYKVPW